MRFLFRCAVGLAFCLTCAVLGSALGQLVGVPETAPDGVFDSTDCSSLAFLWGCFVLMFHKDKP